MSVAEAAHRPATRGRNVKLWLALLAVIGAGVFLAWIGTQSVRGRTVQVTTVQAGTGPTIQPNDGVLMEYEGKLQDGTVFDSSAGRGPVPLIANQTVPGFAQALSKMQKGGRYKARIPSKLAYGDTPPAGGPPAGADLFFDVHIVQVVPNAGLMQGAPQPQ